ncbi:Hypothetical protein SGUI_1739 [Serinicoccus hydrothermalis]|uniref:DUF1365 domain-containing protein n=1 Tax=Serinicoccus hydrothermalis TaxID=1758689 RepID=A0A1B1NCN8_9MICO|nr:DUF1365 domain-containing protein [Serinicoccus hydrothermalis]ANS79135.1 Hypothetical protein SGUI_1739 [Serinicoccus hydrothermalis]
MSRPDPDTTGAALEPPPVPSLVVGTVAHTRHRPVRHSFRYRAYQWLVDIDDLPQHPRPLRWFSSFDAADHLDEGRLGDGIRGDLERFLAHRGVVLQPSDRVLMLANARVLGYVFDPLTVFWCLDASDRLRAVVFEVHNTYGERHAYLLDVDGTGRGSMDKEFYVSPFNDTRGRYAVSLRLTPGRVSVGVGLDRDGGRVLTAVTDGVPEPATARALRRVSLRHALMPQLVTLLVRLHGIRLWRKLPIQDRPTHPKEAVR